MQERIVIIFLSSLVLNCNIAMVWETLDLGAYNRNAYPYVLEGGRVGIQNISRVKRVDVESTYKS